MELLFERGTPFLKELFYSHIRKLGEISFSSYNKAKGRRGFAMRNLLSEVHPELIREWSDKNLPLTPDKVPLVQIKEFGGKVFVVTNGRQALRLVQTEKNARYVREQE